MTAQKKLTVREELFVAAYLASGNGAQAAREAGYQSKAADVKASQLIKRPHIAAAIQAAKGRIVKKLGVTAERVVEEMALIGFSDVRHYRITADGYVALADGAPDTAMRAIRRIKRKSRVLHIAPKKKGAKASSTVIEVDTELELWDKGQQLRNMGDYLKLFKENRSDGDDEFDGLTTEQLNERVLALLKIAAKRKQAATGGRKKAG